MIDYSKITEEEFDRRLASLPASLREAYESKAWFTEIAEIAADNKLEVDQFETFHMLVGLYVLSFINESEFSDEITDKIYIDPIGSDKIVGKIRDLVKTKSGAAGTPAIHAYASPKTTLHPSSETRSFIPPKNDFLKPEFYGASSPKQAPAQIKLDFNSAPKTKSVTTSPDIHPENVIDLKDLPR